MTTKTIYKHYIYQYFDPIRKEPIYIGKGFGNRMFNHLQPSYQYPHPFYHRIEWIQKQNQIPIISKLEEHLSDENATQREKYWIREIGRKDLGKGPLLNLTNGGEGICGFKHSKKTRSKMSHSHTGKQHSKETRLKISISNRGKHNYWLGKTISEETKIKISESHLKLVKNSGQKWKIIHPNKNEEIIVSLSRFCKMHNLDKGAMSKVSKGLREHHKGFQCIML
jgi:group I intron endonuclease